MYCLEKQLEREHSYAHIYSNHSYNSCQFAMHSVFELKIAVKIYFWANEVVSSPGECS